MRGPDPSSPTSPPRLGRGGAYAPHNKGGGGRDAPSAAFRWAAGILGLLVLFAGAAEVQAFNFSFPFPGSSSRSDQPPPGIGPWQYRPQGPSNARGTPTGYPPSGQAPGYQPGPWGYQPGAGYPFGGGYQGQGYPSGPAYPPGGGYPPGSEGYPPGPGYPPGGGYPSAGPEQYATPYRQQDGWQASRTPRVELELSDRQPYVQENVLLKLRVISDRNLDTATPEIPNSNDLLLQKLEGPKARSRTGAEGRREIVNEFVYVVTPLRAGDIELPSLTVTGTMAADGYGQPGGHFESASQESAHLQVRPAMASVQPWLPLQDLVLNATLDGGGEVEEGKPVTLVLGLKADGAMGSQLPSLESWLKSPDFRVYREQTLTEGALSADGRRLEGKRTEYYTLVPRSDGNLRLPEIRIPWWNVATGSREFAGLPIRTLQVEGESGPFGLPASADTQGGGGVSWFWLPLGALALLLLGYWGGVWYNGWLRQYARQARLGERLGERLSSGLRSAAAGTAAGAGALAKRLNPAPIVNRIKPRMMRALPRSTRLLMCVREADRENDPAAWYERFQDMTCRYLQLDSRAPLSVVARRIQGLRPGADPGQIARLMQQLDAALYGKQDIDFARWKKQLKRQVGRARGIVRHGAKRRYFRRPLLPELNPQATRA